MSIATLVKKLREKTGLGLLDCKKALEESDYNVEKAALYAAEHGVSSRKETQAGAIFTYVHHNRSIGVILELQCGTDFVARNEEFVKLGNELALLVAATNPENVLDFLEKDQLKSSGNIKSYIDSFSAKFNEPIKIIRFSRMETLS